MPDLTKLTKRQSTEYYYMMGNPPIFNGVGS